jgi:hypothetical protein
MRRLAPALAMLVPLLLFPAGPARADFHPSCDNTALASATVLLANKGSTKLAYTGQVSCQGAKIMITKLWIKNLTTGAQIGTTMGSCAPSTKVCKKTATVTASNAKFEVAMYFSTDDPATAKNPDFKNVLRRGRWVRTSGVLIQICRPIANIPGQVGLCG